MIQHCGDVQYKHYAIIISSRCCCLLIRQTRRASVSCFGALCSGPDAEPVQGRTGDPAPPATLSSRVSLLQCSNFSIILYNYHIAATFARCTPFTYLIFGRLLQPGRCICRRIGWFYSEFPSIPPGPRVFQHKLSYLAGIKIGYAIASIGDRTPNIHYLCALSLTNALVCQKYCVSTVSYCQICSYCVCKRRNNS